MDIASVSIALSQNNLQQQVGLAVMKMAMGNAADQSNFIAAMANDTSKAMESSVQPYLGVMVDIQA